MFGSIKGYKVFEITTKLLKNGKWSFEEISKNNEKIVEEIENVLDNKGLVFALGKKIDKNRVVKAVYIFKTDLNGDEKVLVFDKKIFSEKISEDVISEFENNIDDVLGAAVSKEQVNRAIFGEKEFELKKVKIGKYEVSSALLWFVWGVLLWVVTDDFIWFCLGICFGATSSYVVKVNGKIISTKEIKRSKKKKKK